MNGTLLLEILAADYVLETPQKIRNQRLRGQSSIQFLDGTIRKDQTLNGGWIGKINLEWVALTSAQYDVILQAYTALLGGTGTLTEDDGDQTIVRLVEDRLPTRIWTAPDGSDRFDVQLALIGTVVA
jgi:hypothetical protein